MGGSKRRAMGTGQLAGAMVVRKVFFWVFFFGCFLPYFQKLVFLGLGVFLAKLRIGVFFWVFFLKISKNGCFLYWCFFLRFQILVFFLGVFLGVFFVYIF